jgi:stage III sporulation protein SpoIIIAA
MFLKVLSLTTAMKKGVSISGSKEGTQIKTGQSQKTLKGTLELEMVTLLEQQSLQRRKMKFLLSI